MAMSKNTTGLEYVNSFILWIIGLPDILTRVGLNDTNSVYLNSGSRWEKLLFTSGKVMQITC